MLDLQKHSIHALRMNLTFTRHDLEVPRPCVALLIRARLPLATEREQGGRGIQEAIKQEVEEPSRHESH